MTEQPAAFVTDGVAFPNGTTFRLKHRGHVTYATVEDGALMVKGQRARSLSGAAHLVTGTSLNGWKVWQCKRPTDDHFITAENLRKSF
jgi:hypothetical protein